MLLFGVGGGLRRWTSSCLCGKMCEVQPPNFMSTGKGPRSPWSRDEKQDVLLLRCLSIRVFVLVRLLSSFSGRPSIQHDAQGAQDEEPAGFFPRVPSAGTREDVRRERATRAQVRFCLPGEGGGFGELTAS